MSTVSSVPGGPIISKLGTVPPASAKLPGGSPMTRTIKKTKKLNTSRPLIISYLRFSRPEQAKGDSTRRQNDLADKWCEANGHKLTDRLDDKGISAFRGRNHNKGALSQFMELVCDGQAG
jgi:hypothetical protein